MSSPQVFVTGAFDDLRSRQIRFLEEASKLGKLTVLLWTDAATRQFTGKPPKFPLAERNYFLNAIRYVNGVIATNQANDLPKDLRANIWTEVENDPDAAAEKIWPGTEPSCHILPAEGLKGFPVAAPLAAVAGRKKVVVTGSYDWFHSGHVRFFEEVSAHGDLYVVVGHDANIRLLKGEGHPLLPQDERRYLAGSIKYVKQALISSGDGWLDADPEIRKLKPDVYAVNEDGDRGGKREYCEQNGIQYLVLKRVPAPGLPPRSSTNLRGF